MYYKIAKCQPGTPKRLVLIASQVEWPQLGVRWSNSVMVEQPGTCHTPLCHVDMFPKVYAPSKSVGFVWLPCFWVFYLIYLIVDFSATVTLWKTGRTTAAQPLSLKCPNCTAKRLACAVEKGYSSYARFFRYYLGRKCLLPHDWRRRNEEMRREPMIDYTKCLTPSSSHLSSMLLFQSCKRALKCSMSVMHESVYFAPLLTPGFLFFPFPNWVIHFAEYLATKSTSDRVVSRITLQLWATKSNFRQQLHLHGTENTLSAHQ